MRIGDRAYFTAGASTVIVTVRDVRDDELVLVQNEVTGTGAYSFLVRVDMLVPIVLGALAFGGGDAEDTQLGHGLTESA